MSVQFFIVLFSVSSPALTLRQADKTPAVSNAEDRQPVVANADNLLCGLGVTGGIAREDACAEKCTIAMRNTELPPFPQHFFGGLNKKQRAKNESVLSDLDAVLKSGKVVLKGQEDFVFPMNMAAYFTCYTRSKWPLFNAWVVAPELQSEDKVAREGSFGNVPAGLPGHQAYHEKYKNEFLRSGDVKGVWSDYYSFDQGHWAPDAPFRQVKDLVSSTYYYVNVSPQSACLNRQEWEHLESSIRGWAVQKNVKVSVMAGPLEKLPKYFVSTLAMRKKWISVLEQWRVASEVLMRGVNTSSELKDPHWVEVIMHTKTHGSQCMLRGDDKALQHHRHHIEFGVEREELKDLATIRSCKPRTLMDSGLGKYAFYLMTQSGKKAVRRGVRIPLAYWKVASWKEGTTQVYCCYLMDQTGIVDMSSTGETCLAEIKTSFDVIPGDITYAGDDTCEQLYSPRGGKEPEQQAAQNTMDCDFASNGIGWRGSYLLEENGIDH